MNGDIELACSIPQPAQELQVILVIPENALLIVTVLQQMVRLSGYRQARLSGHVLDQKGRRRGKSSAALATLPKRGRQWRRSIMTQTGQPA